MMFATKIKDSFVRFICCSTAQERNSKRKTVSRILKNREDKTMWAFITALVCGFALMFGVLCCMGGCWVLGLPFVVAATIGFFSIT